MTFFKKNLDMCYKSEGEDHVLQLFFNKKEKTEILDHLHGWWGVVYYGGKDEKQRMSFSLNILEEILEFIKKYGYEFACDYTVMTGEETILNWYLEDESQHLFIMKNDETIAVYKDHIYRMYENMNKLEECLMEKKTVIFSNQNKVYPTVVWKIAYKSCRQRYGEIFALNRMRFKARIESVSTIISPILNSKYREVVYNKRFK